VSAFVVFSITPIPPQRSESCLLNWNSTAIRVIVFRVVHDERIVKINENTVFSFV